MNTLLARFRRRIKTAPFLRYYLTVLGLVILAAFLRVLHISSIAYSPYSDMLSYLVFRQRFFELGVEGGTVLFPPGYPFFLQFVYLFTKLETIKPALYLQALVDAVATGALAGIGRRFWNARVGILAGVLYAVYKVYVIYCGLLLPEILCIDFSIFTIYCFTRYLHKRTVWLACTVGVLAAIATHLRSNMAVLLPVLGIMALWGNRFRPTISRSRILHAGAMVGTGFLLLLPWSIRNSRIADRPIFVSDNAGFSLAIANNPITDGGYMDLSQLPDFQDKIGSHPGLARHQAMVRYGVHFLKEQPARFFFYLLPNKIRYLFTKVQEIWPWDQDPLGYTYSTHPFGPRVYVPLLPYFLLLPVGLIGILMPGRHASRTVVLLWLATILPLLLMLPSFRYRSASDFLLVLGAGAALEKIITERYFAKRLVMCIAVFGLFTVAMTSLNSYRFSGANILKTNSLRLNPAGRDMIHGAHHLVAKTATPAKPMSVHLGDFHLGANKDSHLLMTGNFSISPTITPDYPMSPNIEVTYFDETSQTVKLPLGPRLLLPKMVQLNAYQSSSTQAWRVLPVPALAKSVRLQFSVNFPAEITVSELSLVGATRGE